MRSGAGLSFRFGVSNGSGELVSPLQDDGDVKGTATSLTIGVCKSEVGGTTGAVLACVPSGDEKISASS